MEKVIHFDLPAVKQRSTTTSSSPAPVPSPPNRPLGEPPSLPSRGREREVQQLIHDLAILAANHRSPV